MVHKQTENMKLRITNLVLLICISVTFSFACNAQGFDGHDSLDINNISCRINVLGDNFDNGTQSASSFFAPINTNMSTVFVSSLWIGGYENGNLKEAAMTYRQGGVDFYPGPLDTTNTSISSHTMNKWNKVWKVKRSEVNDFIKNGTLYTSIVNWPGSGDSGTYESHFMAPYINVSGGNKYNPLKGDYPDIKGDEMIWWVMNDKGGLHNTTMSNPMGIEVRGEAYAFNRPDNAALNNTIFLDYKVINRSKTDLDSVYLSLWTDFDIGYAFDDYVGSAPKLSAFYGYNGTPTDAVYGTNTPVESVIFLKDSMSRFMYYNNDASPVNGNPGYPYPAPQDYYNYMKGVWKNGACMKYGSKDGVSGTQCTDFMFDGSPADSVSGWTEHNVGNLPGDRRGLGSIGPLTIKAGQTYDVPVAYVFSRQTHGNTEINFDSTVQYWKQVKAFYNSNYTSTGINSLVTNVNPINVYPNPASDFIFIQCPNQNPIRFVITDMTGRILRITNCQRGVNMQNIDVSGLSNGIYSIISETNTGVSVDKFVISR